MDRVPRGTSADATATLSVDEVATDPDSNLVSVAATRLDGTSVITSTSATRVAAGVYKIPLTPTHLALLDTLKLTWTYARSGAQITEFTYVEVVGGFLITLAQARQRMADPGFTTADLLSARTEAEQAVEDYFGVAFVPRYALEQIFISGYASSSRIILKRSRPRLIRNLILDGVTYAPDQIAGLLLDPIGGTVDLYGGPLFQTGFIGYEYGYDYPPKPVSDAVLDALVLYSSDASGSSSIDPRATKIITEDGTVELGSSSIASIIDPALLRRYGPPMVA